jgi:hypothetical protein
MPFMRERIAIDLDFPLLECTHSGTAGYDRQQIGQKRSLRFAESLLISWRLFSLSQAAIACYRDRLPVSISKWNSKRTFRTFTR